MHIDWLISTGRAWDGIPSPTGNTDRESYQREGHAWDGIPCPARTPLRRSYGAGGVAISGYVASTLVASDVFIVLVGEGIIMVPIGYIQWIMDNRVRS